MQNPSQTWARINSHSRSVRLSGVAICILLTGVSLTLLALNALSPTINLKLGGEIIPLGGSAYQVDVIPRGYPAFYFTAPDRAHNRSISRLILTEDGRPLGPPHALVEDISRAGLGRYYHALDDRGDQAVLFSSSDNSDPRVNGRAYAATAPVDFRLRVILSLLAVLAIGVAGLLIAYREAPVVRIPREWVKTHPQNAELLAAVVIVTMGIVRFLSKGWPGSNAFAADLSARILSQVPMIASGALLCIAYSVVCLSLGLSVLKVFGIAPRHGNCASASAFLLGLGGLGILWQYLAIFDAFKPSLIYGVCLLSLLAGIQQIKPAMRGAARSVGSGLERLKSLPLVYKVLAVIILLYYVPVFLLLPLRPLYIDALAFYAAQAKLIGHTGSYLPLGGAHGNFLGFLQIGMVMEMNYAVCYALGPQGGGAIALRFLMFPALISMLALCHGIGRCLGLHDRWRWVVLALVFTTSAVTFYVHGGKTDIFAAAFGLAAIYWMVVANRSINTKQCILGGIFTGMAPLIKFPYLLGFLPLTSGLLMWWIFRDWRAGSNIAWRKLSGFAIGGLTALAVGWSLKNAVWTGEPFAPFYLFSDTAPLRLDHEFYDSDAELYLRLIFPLALFFGDFSNSQQHLSPLLLGMIPFLYFPIKKAISDRDISKDLALLSAASLALGAWIIFRPQIILPRHFLASCLAVIFPVVYAAQVYFDGHKEKVLEHLVVIIAIALLILLAHPLRTVLFHVTVPFIAYPVDNGEYERAHPRLKMAAHINRDQRDSSLVYSAGYITEPLNAGDLSRMKYLFVSRKGLERAGIPPGEDPAEFWRRMAREGVDYIMLSMWTQGPEGEAYFNSDAIPPDVDVNVITFREGFILYEFNKGGRS